MMKDHRIVIGCGTGRSGTLSLAMLLDRCHGFSCTHELKPLLTWEIDETLYEHKKNMFLSAQNNVGDVHSAYLPYLERFISDIPSIKIVCTRRNRQDVVHSFERHIANGIDPNRHHWYEHKGRGGWNVDPEWDPAFPKYEIKDRKKAILRYAEDYDKSIDKLAANYPENVLIVGVEELGSFFGQNRIFRFIGIKILDRRFTRKSKSIFNTSCSQPPTAP